MRENDEEAGRVGEQSDFNACLTLGEGESQKVKESWGGASILQWNSQEHSARPLGSPWASNPFENSRVS